MQNHLQQAIVDEGLAIFKAAKNQKNNLFDKEYWISRLLEWVMKDPSFKIDLFRFVDVLPVLTNSDQIAKHIKEYLLKKDRNIPLLMNTALKAASFSFAKGLAASTIRKNVTDMAQRFIAGENIKDAQASLQKLQTEGFCFTVDLLGEKTLSEKEADSYLEQYLKLISELADIYKNNNKTLYDPANISLKISSLSCQLTEEDPKWAVDDLKKRVVLLLKTAKENNIFINFDVESFSSHEIIYELFNEIALTNEFKSWPHLGIVVQAYLAESEQHVKNLINLCQKRNTPITVRLVKGAYWDYEVVKAKILGQKAPVFLQKAQTDLNYERLSKLLLDNISTLRPAFGSHNIRSLASAIAYANSRQIDKNRYEIQMLYGMAEGERKALLDRGHIVRIYVPIGEILPGMSYLVRRLLENTSQMGFLRLSHHEGQNELALLEPPNVQNNNDNIIQAKDDFINIGFTDFTEEKNRQLFKAAVAEVKAALPIEIPIIIGDRKTSSSQCHERYSPSNLQMKVSVCDLAELEHAKQAIDLSVEAFGHMPALKDRASQLEQLAKILVRDRFWLSAIMCVEVGKTWAEADADVAEAIDFCNYYAKLARSDLSPQKMGHIEGERNILLCQGRGPSIIIAPWNFPLAILCGMSVAAYVSGNPIIMKPAEVSSLTALMLYERMIEAGFMKDAVHFLPGEGEKLGPYLVSHLHVANICFTGSMKVGHEIIKLANTVVPGQIQMKRVICEMGGKNAIVVDDDADLDEAITAIIKSAFVYAGQKCSAAARVVVIGDIKNALVERLIAAVQSIKVGDSLEPSTFMGPVVEQAAFDRLNKAIEKLKHDASVKVLLEGKRLTGGYFIPAVIVEVKDEQHWLMQDELFGPILAIYHAKDLASAISVANSTKYALTGAFFSRSPVNIEYAYQHFNVGNLYINQKCTGAIVFRQPFGGFKMSGTGIKAGGPHYLFNFVDFKLVSENTMRRGFTPEISV